MLVQAAKPAITRSFGEGAVRGSTSGGMSDLIRMPPQEISVLKSNPEAFELALPHANLSIRVPHKLGVPVPIFDKGIEITKETKYQNSRVLTKQI